jgi:hypothetical protein
MTLKRVLLLTTFCLAQALSAIGSPIESPIENANEIDPFFTDPKTTKTITVFFGPENARKAYIAGEADGQKKTITLPTVFAEERKNGWRHNDAALQSNRLWFGAVKVGHELFQQEAPYEAPVKYKDNGTTESSQEELVLGKAVYVYKIQNYERPDGTVFQKYLQALYRLHMEEQREKLSDRRITVNSWPYWRKRGLKSKMTPRYKMQDFEQTKVQHITTQLDVTEDRPVAEPTIIKTFLELRPKGSYESNDNEGQPYPSESYKIVN